jgi:subtilase family serine protease
MKRFLLRATLAIGAIALVPTACVDDIVHGPRASGCTLTVWRLPVDAPRDGFVPCFAALASRPVMPGQPAVSLAPDGTTYGPFHAYAPADIYAAYGVDRLHAEGLTGKGQTIVIVDSYGSPTALEDLQTFSRTFGLPEPDLTVIYPDGTPTLNSTTKLSWALESSLDLQWAHAIAPGAKLVLIAANPAESTGVQGFPSMFKGIQQAVEQYPGSVISQSFGAYEQAFQSAADGQTDKFHGVYQQAVAARCTVLACTGDEGTANTDKHSRLVDPFPTVCWPASDPLVTACGGTQLQWGWRWTPAVSREDYWATVAQLGGDWLLAIEITGFLNSEGPVDPPELAHTEAVWNEVATPGSPLGTGGGLSAVFPSPDFQSGIPQSLLQGRRGVPDISWNAALDGGVVTYVDHYSSVEFNGWLNMAGTSASTPQIAGLIALVNQLRAQSGKQPIGYLNPILYKLPASDFNDIVPQTFGPVTLNDNIRFGSGVPGYQTTTGYDLTTGLGSPKAYQFVHDLAATP